MFGCPIVDNWKVVDDKLVVTSEETADIIIKDQMFEEGNVVEVGFDSVVKLGKPAVDNMLHTKRVCNIFKQIIADIEKQERKGYLNPLTAEVVAYTTNAGLPNIKKADIQGMIKELGY